MNLRTTKISFDDLNLSQDKARQFRGYFGNAYNHLEDMHNHINNGYKFAYPVIQYKVIDKIPTIIGIGKGSELLCDNKVYLEDNIIIGKEAHNIDCVKVENTEVEFGMTDNLIEYTFESCWIALNNENQRIYKLSSYKERKEMLEKILINNIISLCKTLKYQAEKRFKVELNVYMVDYMPKLKGQSMIGFKGNFKVNFELPEYIGLGKSVSRGYGCIKRIK